MDVGLAAIRVASKICQAVQLEITPEVLEKKDDSPVTVADFASQAVICQAIGDVFEADPVIAEEDSLALYQPENQHFLGVIQQLICRHARIASEAEICQWIDRGGAKNYSPRFWTVDPIDGTKGFLRRGQYAISLGLIVEGRLELGILGCPNLDQVDHGSPTLFYAIRGQGAFGTNLGDDRRAQPIQVSQTTDSALARFCESVESGHSSHNESAQVAAQLGMTLNPVRMDSQAKYAIVASGKADVYLRLPTKTGYFEKIWDHAGGVLIVEEAGGKVTDLSGRPLDFSRGRELNQNRGVVATNGALHETVLKAVQAVVNSNTD